jgi:hypothetical protein
MPFLRKKKEQIPPVGTPPHQSSRSAHAASDPPSSTIPTYPGYGANEGAHGLYSRSGRNVQDDRNELLAGLDPQKLNSTRFVDGPGLGREPPPGEENEEDIEGIKTQTRFIKQESVNSTRNALRMARQAEETAKATMDMLGSQSGKKKI